MDNQQTFTSNPSRVIHFRNVGPDVSEHDIMLLASGFGTVDQTVMLKNKNQALIQFQDVNAAINFMQYYSSVQANVRGRNIYPQFSSHQLLTGSGSTAVSHTQQPAANSSTPNRILLVTIVNAIYPVTVDILYQVFGSHGMVEKIVVFNKTKGLQALVQYGTVQSAQSAREALHGQNIYTNGSCQLHIQYSNLSSELTVTANSDRSKDFTKPNLPTAQPTPAAPVQPPAIMSQPVQYGMGMVAMQPSTEFYPQPPLGHYGLAAMPMGFGAQQQSQYQSVLLVSNLPTEKITCSGLFNLFSSYGNVLRVKFLHNKPDHALVQMGDYFQASTAMQFLKGLTLWGKRIDINPSKHNYIIAISNDPNDTSCADFSTSHLNRFKFNQGSEKAQQIYKHMSGPCTLLHVSNIPPTSNEEMLSEIFGPFGKIQALKVFDYNGKHQALVQFQTIENAAEALIILHNTPLEGRGLKISFSKNKI